jgi:hypothetical protein
MSSTFAKTSLRIALGLRLRMKLATRIFLIAMSWVSQLALYNRMRLAPPPSSISAISLRGLFSYLNGE